MKKLWNIDIPLSMMMVYVFSVVDTINVDAYIVALAPIHASSLDDVVVAAALATCDAAMFANADAGASSGAGATNVTTVVMFVVS
jgi:hypothetical protein